MKLVHKVTSVAFFGRGRATIYHQTTVWDDQGPHTTQTETVLLSLCKIGRLSKVAQAMAKAGIARVSPAGYGWVCTRWHEGNKPLRYTDGRYQVGGQDGDQ